MQTSDKTRAQVARDLDLTDSALRNWVAHAQPRGTGAGAADAELNETQKLRKEVRVLRMERDLLKKGRPPSPRSRREVRVHPSAEG